MSQMAHIAAPAPPQADEHEFVREFGQWHRTFAAERLRVLYIVGLVANPAFAALDYLVHHDHLASLLNIRLILEAGLFLGYLALRQQRLALPPKLLLLLWVLIPNICVVEMTILLGGFTSQYYNGLSLVLLAAAVIVPVYWPSHLAAQLATLAYYYAANALRGGTLTELNAAIENSFFLVWTCVALIISVTLYERLLKAEFRARWSEEHARKQLEASNQKLLELDKLKNEFFANISHEFRTPLTLALGTFRALRASALPQECQRLVATGLRNTSRLLSLINELLELARFDSGRAELRKRSLDLAALLRSVAANFESSDKRRVHLTGTSDPIAIEADPRQLRHVFYNLLSNAFKFSDPEAGQVWMILAGEPDSVTIEVKDNGIGIPRDQLGRIFDRFTQVESSATRRFEGSGIGLALVKEIVTHHGGRISVDSEVDRGSTFRVTLPRGRARLEHAEVVEEDDTVFLAPPLRDFPGRPASPVPSSPAAAAGRPVVLIADDNPDMLEYLHSLLSRDYRTILAKDGAEALKLSRDTPPDLILTDVMMPNMSGYDLLTHIRGDEALRSTPVIFLTARAGVDARIESLEAGADDYVAKPFDEHEIQARVKNLVTARARERQILELQKDKLLRFLPRHIGEMVLSRSGEKLLTDHRREITVVFVDLRGFTAFAETAEPEDLMTVLREYQAEMGRLIMRYEGTLERFSGDAMMVFFNDPLPVPTHTEQAVRMALAMRTCFGDLHARWFARGIELGAGMGIATGYATLGMIGFEARHDYAAIGNVTNLAARLCSEARHDQILITSRVYHLLEGRIRAESVGELLLKGFHRPVLAYNLHSLADDPTLAEPPLTQSK